MDTHNTRGQTPIATHNTRGQTPIATRSAGGLTLRVLALLGGSATLVFAACGSADPDGNYGVLASPPLPVQAPSSTFDPAVDIADVDGSVVATADGGELAFAGPDGDLLSTVDVSPGAELRALSATGAQAALFERPDPTSSRITVVDQRTGNSQIAVFDLPGLVEPEAFSTDGTLLFVIDHEIATLPGAYRVRPLNLETGQLETIVGPQKVPFDDDMNGIGRRQIWAPDGTRLYTLYIRQTHHHLPDGTEHATGAPGTDGFVHVLDLDDEWAFCLDLPEAFGGGDLATTALAVAPDGASIAVADLSAGQVAFASTANLTVTRTESIPDFQVDEELQLGLTTSEFVLGFGTELHWFGQQSMQPIGGPTKLASPLTAITSNGAAVLAWTSNLASGPVLIPAPSR